jgi:hypothetical protein
MGKLYLYPVGRTFLVPAKSEFDRANSINKTIYLYKSPNSGFPPKLKKGKIYINKNSFDRF